MRSKPIPQLLNEVHRLIETKKHIFALTGSSARSVRKKGVNLLAGRAVIYHMHPLIFQALEDAFDVHTAVNYRFYGKYYQNLNLIRLLI